MRDIIVPGAHCNGQTRAAYPGARMVGNGDTLAEADWRPRSAPWKPSQNPSMHSVFAASK